MQSTSIEWTDATWNPVRGCTRVSEGCRHCYAETMAGRFSKPGQWGHGFATFRKAMRIPPRHQGLNVETGEVEYSAGRNIPAEARWTGKVELISEKLSEPLRMRRGRRIFVNSTSDLFHEKLTNEEIAAVFGVMAACPQHTFQVLTKRPERAADWFRWVVSEGAQPRCPATSCAAEAFIRDGIGKNDFFGPRFDDILPWPLPNVWLGTSVEDQDTANKRIPHLLRCPAAVRFLSCEPLLGPVDLRDLVVDDGKPGEWHADALFCDVDPEDDEGFNGATISQVICGGESGPKARPMHPEWARSLRDQCAAAGVSFFMKQMARREEIPEDLRIREFPKVA